MTRGRCLGKVFDELTEAEAQEAVQEVAAAGLHAARAIAVKRLLAGPAVGLGKPAAIIDLLMARDQADPRWERLAPFERQWALLVLRIAAPSLNPLDAVTDARRRGASWANIGAALGVTTSAAHERFRKQTC